MSATVSSTIVVGVDGSPESAVAAEWAATEADRRHAELVVLAACAPYPAGLPGVPDAGEYLVRSERAGVEMVSGSTHRLQARHPGLVVTGRFLARDPRTALVAASESAVLTVVGTRGTGRLHAVLVGSVALHLASQARSPVAVIPHRAVPATGPVLVGVDPRGGNQPAIDLAFDEAARRDAELVAVLAGDRVVGHQGFARRPVQPLPVEIESEQAVLAEQLCGWREKYPEVRVTPMLMNGRVADCLARFADLTGHPQPQLTVVGNRGHGSMAGLILGSTSHDIIAAGTGPVLVVPASARRFAEAR